MRKFITLFLCIFSFSFPVLASNYDSLIKEYNITNEDELDEALYMYRMIKDDYNFDNSSELMDALYFYRHFDEIISGEEFNIIDEEHRKAIEDYVSEKVSIASEEAHDKGVNDGFRSLIIGIPILVILAKALNKEEKDPICG